MQKVNLNSVDDGATRRSKTSQRALAQTIHRQRALASCFKLRSRVCRTCGLGLLTAVGLGLAPSGVLAAGPAYEFHVVAYLGDAAPGGGVFNNDFEPTALNNRGQLAFTAEPDPTNGEAIFIADNNGLTQIARYGQAAPGGGTFGQTEFGEIGINDSGDLAFGFAVGDVGNIFRWSHAHQALSAVIVPDLTPAPDGSGVLVGSYGNTSINNQGAIAFIGNVTNPPPATFKFVPYRSGVFVADRLGGISTVAQPGDAAPGGGTFISAGAMYATAFGFLFFTIAPGPSINDGGDVAFGGQVVTGTNLFNDTFGVYVRRFATGSMEQVPLPLGVAPGVASSISINNHGDVAFGVNSGDPGNYAFGSGLGVVCLNRGGSTVAIIALKDAAPGGGHFNTLGYEVRLNNRGDLAFTGQTDTHDEAVYVYQGATGELQRMGGIGTAIPGAGVIVDLNQSGRLAGYTAFNDHGQIALVANVTDGTTIRRALLLATPSNGVN